MQCKEPLFIVNTDNYLVELNDRMQLTVTPGSKAGCSLVDYFLLLRFFFFFFYFLFFFIKYNLPPHVKFGSMIL